MGAVTGVQLSILKSGLVGYNLVTIKLVELRKVVIVFVKWAEYCTGGDNFVLILLRCILVTLGLTQSQLNSTRAVAKPFI